MSKHYSHIPAEGRLLHRTELERDACGVGLVANINGERSNKILCYGLASVCHMTHRGAVDADQKTGDGAGVLTQIPYGIFIPYIEEELKQKVKKPSDIGVGSFFLPTEGPETLKAKILIEGVLRNRGLSFLGWREVPTNPKALGEKAKLTKPEILHAIVSRPAGMTDDDEFERKLYLSRREIERKAAIEKIKGFNVNSLSHRTLSYKALLIATAMEKFYIDLLNPKYETAICLYHQRFSTNTFPTWSLGQPFRMLAHNGEINTLRGNRNWLSSRESDFQHEVWGDDVEHIRDVIDYEASDSASLDAALELLVVSGRSLPHAISLLVPPAWRMDPATTESEAAFYRFNRCFAEPWDGPAALVYTDGRTVAASLDRNGLRPARYKLTKDGTFTLGSEVGVIELDDSEVIEKGRLGPGQMIVIDTETGAVKHDKEIKAELATAHPYSEWLKERVEFSDIADPEPPKTAPDTDPLTLSQKQVAFGYNKEELDISMSAMVANGMEATHSMGDDAPLSVLSVRPKLLYTYFKQLFAQVTNPPIDPIRERLVMTLAVCLGWQRNLLKDTPDHAKVINLETPFLFEPELELLKNQEGFPSRTIDITWPASEGPGGMEQAVKRICEEAEKAVDDKIQLLILSDRAIDHANIPIPALLATGAVHHHLNRQAKRMRLSLIVESGEARDTHQAACLFGFGAQALCPYMAYATINEMLENDKRKKLGEIDYQRALLNYRTAMEKGVLKIMSKMGISVLGSYQGAQIFEAVGLSTDLIAECFAGTPSQIEGIGFQEVAIESITRHSEAYGQAVPEAGDDREPLKLGDPGFIRYRRDGELHSINQPVIKNFHTFIKSNDPKDYEAYVAATLENRPVAIHDMFEFVPQGKAIDISEVEPVEDIRVRFTTAAMSLGALSPEAHEMLAVAMNRIGGKSNSGEGGEEVRRFTPYENGDWANSKIKQVASGRFGVSAEYLASAQEIEIKMAQGAKPGEGGQLPAHKVNGIIAKLRRTQPGVQLISPPPHHDIYSIEDLAQLIHDLKEVNPRARVCVKLVSETGVGTVAAGVAKANADIILVSGHEGGTGASPLSSIKHAGLPWELGIAETQQVLMINGLRDRVTLRTDGGLRNGRDIITAAALGAEEFNFGTIALIAMGCVYVRKCHLNTCPVGIATQDPKYRKKFKGEVEHVVNFFNSVAQETRELMASLGVRKLEDLIGHPEFLRQREVPDHPKANLLDLSKVLRNVPEEVGEDLPRICGMANNDGMHVRPLDDRILQDAKAAINGKLPIELYYRVHNTNRNVGTKLSGEIAYQHGDHGLPANTVKLNLKGSAGQSFGTFLVNGVSLTLTGEANDYVGKGMAGGEIIIKPPENRAFKAAENSILGNTVLYGATAGELFASGLAGERFCVRNSGATAVVEGVGDHCCEYMTNGTVLILGHVGKNFGAGMSGGIAYIFDKHGTFEKHYNDELIEFEALKEPEDIEQVKALLQKHLDYTESERAKEILDGWKTLGGKFIKVQPKFRPWEDAGEEDAKEESTAAASK